MKSSVIERYIVTEKNKTVPDSGLFQYQRELLTVKAPIPCFLVRNPSQEQ